MKLTIDMRKHRTDLENAIRTWNAIEAMYAEAILARAAAKNIPENDRANKAIDYHSSRMSDLRPAMTLLEGAGLIERAEEDSGSYHYQGRYEKAGK